MRAVSLLVFLCIAGRAHADAVDDFVNAEMKKARIPGASIAVIKDGNVVKAAGYGVANLETMTPATAETVYKTASLSKPILAAAVLLLAERGKIGLDDQAAKYLIGAPESWSGITIRRLLSHTSGMTRDPKDYQPYKEQPVTAVIESAYSLPLEFAPGEKWLYSNIGYYVLAEIVSMASGMAWDEFIAKNFFEPAGMTATRLTSVAAVVPNRARGYDLRDGRMQNAEDWIAVRPSAAYLSTVLDLAKLDGFLSKRALLRAATIPATLNSGATTNYGFGWFVDSYLGRARIHHDGQFPGFRTDWERFTDDKLTVIVLTNSGATRVEGLAIRIAAMYEPGLASPEFSTVSSRAEPMRAGQAGKISVVARNGARAAPDSLVELEIWDETNRPVNKQNRQAQSFAAGESKTYEFEWTPSKPGKYTVSVGIFGPRWVVNYSWSERMATLDVR